MSTSGRHLSAVVIATVVVALVPSPASAQEATPSLGEVARKARAQKKATPAQVLTNEDLKKPQGPIPAIKTDGPENSKEILEAIHKYRASHSRSDTEQVVREWFEEHMEMARQSVETNMRIAAARNTPFGAYADPTNPYENGVRYREEQEMRWYGQRKDWNLMARNSERTERLVETMRIVRDDFVGASGCCSWFDLRFFYVRYYWQP